MGVLRKLFVSFNNLKTLPENIGQCHALQKLRLIQNQLEVLPFGFLDLWQQNGGMLEELLVTRNPLKLPSLTSFEMGGIDLAMRLLSECAEEFTITETPMPQLDGEGIVGGGGEGDGATGEGAVDPDKIDVNANDTTGGNKQQHGTLNRGMTTATVGMDSINASERLQLRADGTRGRLTMTAAEAYARKRSQSLGIGLTSTNKEMLLSGGGGGGGGTQHNLGAPDGGKMLQTKPSVAASNLGGTAPEVSTQIYRAPAKQDLEAKMLARTPTTNVLGGVDVKREQEKAQQKLLDATLHYFFSGMENRMTEIRQMENTLLLAKKKMGLQLAQANAKEKLSEGSALPTTAKAELQAIIDSTVATYHGKIPVADLDL